MDRSHTYIFIGTLILLMIPISTILVRLWAEEGHTIIVYTLLCFMFGNLVGDYVQLRRLDRKLKMLEEIASKRSQKIT